MTDTQTEQYLEAPGRALLRRTFEAEITADGRTVDLRVVPYDVSADVSDGGPVYREEWAPGCFDDQLVAGHRLKVFLNFEHHPGVGNIIGRGIELRSERDGLHGSFELLDTQNGETARQLVAAGDLEGVSLEAKPKHRGTIRTASGVVRRVRAHLVNVALCRHPAYPDARVLALREEPEEIVWDEKLLPLPADPVLMERCHRVDVNWAAQLKAHPAESGTPALSGTPGDGTRHGTVNPSTGGSAL